MIHLADSRHDLCSVRWNLKSASVLELLACEDEALLIGRDAFLVLDFGLDVFDGVGLLDVEGDGLAGEGFDEDLYY